MYGNKDRDFNPHGNKTADGVLITKGLVVFDNNLDVGTVVADGHDGDFGRTEDHWYVIEMHLNYKGEPMKGQRSMNGERLATYAFGKKAPAKPKHECEACNFTGYRQDRLDFSCYDSEDCDNLRIPCPEHACYMA